jgi:hypothetical protein
VQAMFAALAEVAEQVFMVHLAQGARREERWPFEDGEA